MAFDAALNGNLPLAALVSDRRIETGYASCVLDGATMMADAAPYIPARHRALQDNPAPVPVAAPNSAPPVPAIAPQRDATLQAPHADGVTAQPVYERDAYNRDPEYPGAANRDDGDNEGAYANAAPSPYQQAYRGGYAPYPYTYGPYAYAPYNSGSYAYSPPAATQWVRSADGGWYQVPSYGR